MLATEPPVELSLRFSQCSAIHRMFLRVMLSGRPASWPWLRRVKIYTAMATRRGPFTHSAQECALSILLAATDFTEPCKQAGCNIIEQKRYCKVQCWNNCNQVDVISGQTSTMEYSVMIMFMGKLPFRMFQPAEKASLALLINTELDS